MKAENEKYLLQVQFKYSYKLSVLTFYIFCHLDVSDWFSHPSRRNRHVPDLSRVSAILVFISVISLPTPFICRLNGSNQLAVGLQQWRCGIIHQLCPACARFTAMLGDSSPTVLTTTGMQFRLRCIISKFPLPCLALISAQKLLQNRVSVCSIGARAPRKRLVWAPLCCSVPQLAPV